MKKYLLFLILLSLHLSLKADDGSSLWLRYTTSNGCNVTAPKGSATVDIAVAELQKYWSHGDIELSLNPTLTDGDGYKITMTAEKTLVEASKATGLLYATYDLLRHQKLNTLGYLSSQLIAPRFALRILNHWDNPDGSVERGYAGKSIFKWNLIDGEKQTLDAQLEARLKAYARANASIGINGSVLNNVNAKPQMLSTEYLKKVEVIASLLRPYGIKVYLSVNFGSPIVLGKLKTANPLDKNVRRWWTAKAKEIYTLIPDFGGFLVKANSEGQPGPGDYHRSHAQGANMLADAVGKYGGIVMWRSFVYGANHKGEDRVKQAVSEFKDLDGQFRKNVILQSKNGPLDFQPREPYAPIFDNISKTNQMAELQITQEYTGQSIHLVYLAPMWKEFFSYVSPDKLSGVAGVANIGDDNDWCGHEFSQSNWYAFGRLAWNPDLSSEDIAAEWLAQTFTSDYYFVHPMTDIMMRSREACVDYMMPLGLHHIFKFDHHYGPEPDGFKPDYPIEWCPVYYHKADSAGIGFNRTSTGSGATSQYREPYRSLYDDINTCPEQYLLWFHHVEWNYKLKNGNTLWQNLCSHYNKGVREVQNFNDTWQQMRPFVDAERWNAVADRLHKQLLNAEEWRDVCLKYFQTFSKQQITNN